MHTLPTTQRHEDEKRQNSSVPSLLVGNSSTWASSTVARPASRIQDLDAETTVRVLGKREPTTTTTNYGSQRSPLHGTTEIWSRERSGSEPSTKSPILYGGSGLSDPNGNTISRAFSKSCATLSTQPRTRSPEDRRHSSGHLLNCVPEDSEMSMEPTRLSGRSTAGPSRSPNPSQMYYGSVCGGGGYPASIEIEGESELCEEEEEWILDEELAKSGLYRGDYRNIIVLYTFVPLTALLAFVVLAVLPTLAFRSSSPSMFPYPPYFPFPFPEIFTSAALWSLSYLLRDIFYDISVVLTAWIPFATLRFPNFIPFLTALLAALLQNSAALVLRQLAVPILLIPLYSTEHPLLDGGLHVVYHFPTWEDGAFKRVWWVALGWAAAEAVVGIKEGYENIGLYKDVLVNVRKNVVGPETPPHPAPASGEMDAESTPRVSALDRFSQERRVPLAEREGQSTLDFPRRREHSSSLSSNASGHLYEDLSGSAMLGERQPLLTLTSSAPADRAELTTRTAVARTADRLRVESEVEQDLEELVRLKNMEELEEVYGIPVIRIPVFISCLHRINTILSSLAVCLTLTAAYMRSSIAYSCPATLPSKSNIPYFASFFPSLINPANQCSNLVPNTMKSEPSFTPSNRGLIISFFTLLTVQTIFSLMHTPWILPRIGVHTFVYIGLVVWLGFFFGALGLWDALS